MNKGLKLLIAGVAVLAVGGVAAVSYIAKNNILLGNQDATVTEESDDTSIQEEETSADVDVSTNVTVSDEDNTEVSVSTTTDNKENTNDSTVDTSNSTNYVLKSGEGSLTIYEESGNSYKFTVSGKYSESEKMDEITGVAQVNAGTGTFNNLTNETTFQLGGTSSEYTYSYDEETNIITSSVDIYSNDAGDIMTLQKLNNSYFVVLYDNTGAVLFKGAYLPN